MKHILAVMGFFTIMALVTVPLMAQSTIEVPQVQVGTFSTSGNNLVNGSGERQLTVAISFPKAFKVKPQVIVAITLLDIDGRFNSRVSVTAEGISRDGCTAVIKTWADSKINAVQGSWVAVAPTTVKVK
jgi:hypothetical protein